MIEEESYQSYPIRWYILSVYSVFACLQVVALGIFLIVQTVRLVYLTHGAQLLRAPRWHFAGVTPP